MFKKVKYWGSPGTGKTTQLLEDINELKFDYEWEDIAFCTYSTKMADDFIRRLYQKFNFGEYDKKDSYQRLRYFGTIHSVCRRVVEDIEGRKEVADDTQKAEFCLKHKIDFEGENDTTTFGGKFFATKTWLINTLKDPIDSKRWGGEEPIDTDNYLHFLKLWNEFKAGCNEKKTEYIDFDDMLVQAYTTELYPPAKVLIVDEFQDLSPIQYKIYQIWKKHAEVVLIAGDINQAIYSFQGASPDFFIREDLPQKTLPLTYRLGVNGWEYAMKILNQNKLPIPETKCAHEKEDIISTLPLDQFTHYVHSNRRTYVLGTTNRISYALGLFLKNTGIPFYGRKSGGWGDKMKGIYNCLVLLKNKEGYVDAGEAKVFLQNFRKEYLRLGMKKKDIKGMVLPQTLDYQTLIAYFNPIWGPEIGKIPFDFSIFIGTDFKEREKEKNEDSTLTKRETIENALMRDGCLPFRGDGVYVGTVHSVKGGEAEDVFLHNAISPAAYEAEDRKELARVFFVGVTRHKERLFLLEDLSQPFTFTLPKVFNAL